MPEWKPEYDKVKAVKRSADESQGPDKDLTSGSGCLVGALVVLGAVLLLVIAAIGQVIH